MKKCFFQQDLFNATHGLKNWARRHRDDIKETATAVAVLGATVGVLATFKDPNVKTVDTAVTAPTPVETTAPAVTTDVEKLTMLLDIVHKLNLTPDQIDVLCEKYALPREIFNANTTVDNTAELAK